MRPKYSAHHVLGSWASFFLLFCCFQPIDERLPPYSSDCFVRLRPSNEPDLTPSPHEGMDVEPSLAGLGPRAFCGFLLFCSLSAARSDLRDAFGFEARHHRRNFQKGNIQVGRLL